MRLLSKRQLKEMALYSPQHIARLKKGRGIQALQILWKRVASCVAK